MLESNERLKLPSTPPAIGGCGDVAGLAGFGSRLKTA